MITITSRSRRVLAMACAIGLTALAWATLATPSARIVYNPSDSMPRGWYHIERINATSALRVGDIVLARLPTAAATLASQRRYLPLNVPLLKPIAALTPQRVCVDARTVRIDGASVGVALRVDSKGRALSTWRHCRRLVDGELFLLSTTNPASFDSRYFGPISDSAVIGRAQPLWTWRSP